MMTSRMISFFQMALFSPPVVLLEITQMKTSFYSGRNVSVIWCGQDAVWEGWKGEGEGAGVKVMVLSRTVLSMLYYSFAKNFAVFFFLINYIMRFLAIQSPIESSYDRRSSVSNVRLNN